MFVSKRAYEERGLRIAALEADKERLERRIESLTDHIVRLERAKEGLPENAPQPRKPVEPMPDKVSELIAEWGDKEMQADLTRRAWNLYRARRSWDYVYDKLEMAVGAE